MVSSHYFSNSLNTFCRNSVNCDIRDWLATFTLDELRNLQYRIESLLSPLPIGITSQEGFDLHYLAFAAESQMRKRRIVNLSWQQREQVLVKIAQQICGEVDSRCLPTRASEDGAA